MQGSKNSFFARTEKRAKYDDYSWSERSSYREKVDHNKEERHKANKQSENPKKFF